MDNFNDPALRTRWFVYHVRSLCQTVTCVVGVGLLCFITIGCRPLRFNTIVELKPDESRMAPAESGAMPRAIPDIIPPADLDNPVWVVAPPSDDVTLPRWRQEEVDRVWMSPQLDRDALATLLTNDQPVIAANAAIALARLDDDRGREILMRTVLDAQQRLELRRAAADALGLLTGVETAETLRRLIDTIAGAPEAKERTVVYVPELHAELLYALSRHVDAADEIRLAPQGNPLSTDVKLAAIQAWSRGRETEMPALFSDWRSDVDARVRVGTIQAFAHRHSSAALGHAQAGLNDTELEVRIAAIRALGKLGGPRAREQLSPLASHSGELIRAAAIEALDRLGDEAAVRKAAVDKSWRVRSAVAASLAMHPQASYRDLAQELVVDRSLEVQRQAVTAIAHWPMPLAGPVLFSALDKSSYSVKKLALEQFVKRWPIAQEHSIDLPTERATVSLAALRNRWRQEFSESDESTTLASDARVVAELSSEQIALARQILATLNSDNMPDAQRRSAQQQLQALGPGLLRWLEAELAAQPIMLPADVYRQVLPPLSGEFALLVEFDTAEVTARRRAAERLPQRATEQALSSLAIERLTQLLERETDPIVWRNVMRAVKTSDSAAACRLAYLCIASPSDEVRRLACEHLIQHPALEHAAVLEPLLKDPHPAVARAALAALSKPGVLLDPTPLKQLLTADDRRLRLDAAKALVQRHEEVGVAALERMAFDADIDLRRQAVQAMGELRRAEFSSTLVQLLDQNQGVGQAAETSLSQIAGPDITRRVTRDSRSLDERIAAWRHWWETNPR